MSGEHNTPVGTPVVIAPGKIPLVGEYALVEDGYAVVAAIGRHARAQFIPRADSMSRLVAEMVRRTQLELGEVFAALPAGSVLVDSEDFRDKVKLVGLGSSAATAVATVGALLETLGLPIESRKSLIFAIADTGRRAVQGEVGSGADSLAATYGGLVQISRTRGGAPHVLPLAPPSGLRLVLFSAGPALPPQQVVEGIKKHAQLDSLDFEKRSRALRDHAQRFVDEIVVGRATGALAAAGRYADELGGLCSAAQVPIVTESFFLAGELARELGGVAKPTGAGNGEIGVAMFATPEAADLFRKAAPPCLTILAGDIDRRGVRCQEPSAQAEERQVQIESFPTPLPEPSPTEILPSGEYAMIQVTAEDADTAPTTISSTAPVVTVGPRKSLRRRVLPVLSMAAMLILLAWFALPGPVRARFHMNPPQLGGVRPAGTESISPPPPRPHEPPAPTLPEPVKPSPPPQPAVSPEPEPSQETSQATAQGNGMKRPRKIESSRPATSMPRRTGAFMPAPSTGSIGKPAPRAGRLSTDDF